MSHPLASLALVTLLPALATSIVNAALPELAGAFGASFQSAQGIVLAYLVPMTALGVAAGRLGDRIGRRRLLLAGIALFTAASMLAGLAPSLAALLAARAIQGTGAAVMMALAMALAGVAVPRERAGRAMGLLGTMSAVGTALGPALGGLLLARFGWRALFLAMVPVGLFALALARRRLPDDRPLASPDASVAVAGEAPALALLRTPAIGAGLATSALVSTVMMTTLVVGPFYLSLALGLTATGVSLALSIGPLVAALAGVPAGWLVDRLGARRVAMAGLAGMACGAGALAAMPAPLGLAAYLVPIACMTASYAVFQAANNTAVVFAAGAARRGAVSGLLGLSRNLGLIAGASVMGSVFELGTASGEVASASPGAVALGMRIAFGTAAAMVMAGLGVNGTVRARVTHPDPVASRAGLLWCVGRPQDP